MNELQTELKDWVIEFRSEIRGQSPRQPIYIAEQQANGLMSVLSKGGTRFIELPDNAGFTEELIETRLVTGVKKAKDRTPSQVGAAVCDYGTRHPHLGKDGFEECGCAKRFGNLAGFLFEKEVRKRWPEVQYSSDITPAMQGVMERGLNKTS